MKCNTCKKILTNDDNHILNITIPTMIKVGENCFPILTIESNKIIYDISELYPEEKMVLVFSLMKLYIQVILNV